MLNILVGPLASVLHGSLNPHLLYSHVSQRVGQKALFSLMESEWFLLLLVCTVQ